MLNCARHLRITNESIDGLDDVLGFATFTGPNSDADIWSTSPVIFVEVCRVGESKRAHHECCEEPDVYGCNIQDLSAIKGYLRDQVVL